MQYRNFLGIDYGKSHTGLAISLNGSLPLSFTTLSGNTEELVSGIKKIVKDNSIEVIVLGLAYSKAHGAGQKEKTLQFKKRLGRGIPNVLIETWDETMTSKLAQRYATKEKEHQEAARIVLEDWMGRNP